MPTDFPPDFSENLAVDWRSELARRLYAALVSTRLGVGMDYALKRYAPDASKNAYWLELAERVERDYVESFEEATMPPKSNPAGV
jgi:hypothetical protein